MGMYALDMMDIAIEIANHDIAFEDMATKFYEHFVIISAALNELGLTINHIEYSIQYDPADSTSGLYGGNSNRRGPVRMPINYLL